MLLTNFEIYRTALLIMYIVVKHICILKIIFLEEVPTNFKFQGPQIRICPRPLAFPHYGMLKTTCLSIFSFLLSFREIYFYLSLGGLLD